MPTIKNLARLPERVLVGFLELFDGPPGLSAAYEVERRDLSALRRCPVHGEELKRLVAEAVSSRIADVAAATARAQYANELDDECRAACRSGSGSVPPPV
jgi:hypothetical protein